MEEQLGREKTIFGEEKAQAPGALLPSREEALALLKEGERLAPGEWTLHCRVTAECAEKIAAACKNLDPEKAYVLGLLHDIGRRFGKSELHHVIAGYSYMKKLGYTEAARICMTHSFPGKNMQEYVGAFDVSAQEAELIRTLLELYEYDDYDRLIQLCDSISTPQGVVTMEAKMDAIAVKYGYYPPDKRKALYRLKQYFENRMGENLYRIAE